MFTGNELGALLGWWMFHCWKQQNSDAAAAVKKVYMLSSTVSSKILRAIALKEGFHFEVTDPDTYERKTKLPVRSIDCPWQEMLEVMWN